MSNVPTPHNSAKKGDFAKTVIMSGDPLRSKYIAENYLENAKLVNNVRGIQGYTGYYKGKKISVMAHGMGMPSMSIYAHELYAFYGVENIIRIGSCGGLTKDMHVRDIVLAKWAYTPSNIAKRIYKDVKKSYASKDLLKLAEVTSKENNVNVKTCGALTYDIFDVYAIEDTQKYVARGCEVAEMEIFVLYLLAEKFNKKAISFLTVSDNGLLKEELSSEDRQNSFNDMIKCALETAIKL